MLLNVIMKTKVNENLQLGTQQGLQWVYLCTCLVIKCMWKAAGKFIISVVNMFRQGQEISNIIELQINKIEIVFMPSMAAFLQ